MGRDESKDGRSCLARAVDRWPLSGKPNIERNRQHSTCFKSLYQNRRKWHDKLCHTIGYASDLKTCS
jgi:hypothetical protein